MRQQAEKIINTTAADWLGLPEPTGTPALDGVNGLGICSREAESGAAGHGSIGSVEGDLRGCERGTQAFAKPRFGRWAGQGLGVRPPMAGETPLSRSEVEHGIEHDIIDALPTRRILKQVGEWELANVRLMGRASFFDGLLA